MGYLYDRALHVLGGNKLVGAAGMDYGNWTPNGVRSLLLTVDAIVVEYHPPYNKGKLQVDVLKPKEVQEDLKLGPRKKDPLRALEHKQFQMLEEIIIDQALGIDPTRFMSRVDPKDRLRQVSVVPWNPNMTKAYVSRLPDLRTKQPNSTIISGLGLQVSALAQCPGASDWYGRVNLNPRVYKSDIKGGALERYFTSVAEDNGVTPKVEEVDKEANKNPLEVANIQANRINVAADIEAYAGIGVVLAGITALRREKDKPTSDKEGASTLQKRLIKTVRRTGGVVPGLAYYLDEYGDNDGVPAELVKAYTELGYIDKDKKSSRAKIEETAGYFNIEEGVLASVRSVYNSRKERKLYVPDSDKWRPTLETLPEFVSLLTGGPFDFVKYSEALQEVASSGDVELLDSVLARVSEARKSTDKAVKSAATDIEKVVYAGFDDNVKFFKKVQDGAVSAGRDVYIHNISGATTSIVNGSYEPVKNLLVIGLKVFLNRKTPWGAIAAPFIDSIIDAVGPQLLEAVNGLFDALDKKIEGEREEDSELTPELEAALTTIFESEMRWNYGTDMLFRFLSDVETFSSLKRRQVARFARSKTGIAGLAEFLEKNKDKLGENAKKLFEKWDYLKTVEGQGVNVNLEVNKLLTPLAFYEIIYKNFNTLSKSAAKSEVAGATDALAEMDAKCREVMGMASRTYNVPTSQGVR